ncbi:MAG: co-chaperone HscB, partial [Giesbergeria sp.]|nr:co-chaperone HscB [Giesbergeria sp.]
FEVQQARSAGLERCAELLDTHSDFAGAAQQVRALMFIARFAKDIAQRQDQLGE